MSNSLAIATTTVVLGQIVQSGLAGVTSAGVSTVRPDEKKDGVPAPEVNVFLYQVTSNAALRNADLPTRSGNGEPRRRPQVGLDLDYLVSFYGDEKTLEPQRLLGGAVTALHAHPRVTRSQIEKIIDDAPSVPADDPRHYLENTDLDEQVEHVTITPLPLGLEELSRLWSTFFRVPYVLSVAYRVSVVLIEAQLTPKPAPPVRLKDVMVLPMRRPLVEGVAAQEGQNEPIVAGTTLVVRGDRLRGEDTRLRVGRRVVTPNAKAVDDDQIRVTLGPPLFPSETLRPGVQGAQVIHMVDLGTPSFPHRGFESNVAPFVLRPTLLSAQAAEVTGTGDQPRSATVTVTIDPPVAAGQRVVLLLDDVGGGGAYSFQAPARKLDSDPVKIPIEGVNAAEYLVRVQVDGAESQLEVETTPGPDEGRYKGPILPIP